MIAKILRWGSLLTVGALMTWSAPSRAEDVKQLNMLYVGVEANVDSVRDGAKRYIPPAG